MEFLSLEHLPAGFLPGLRKGKTVEFLQGHGLARGFLMKIEAGGSVGPVRAAAGQLWVPLKGNAWIAGEDLVKWRLLPGHGVFIPKGERHTKGSDKGVLALMFQVDDLRLLQKTG